MSFISIVLFSCSANPSIFIFIALVVASVVAMQQQQLIIRIKKQVADKDSKLIRDDWALTILLIKI
jgi:hypothetical protein